MKLQLVATVVVTLAAQSLSAADAEALGGLWMHQDIGNVEVKGTASAKSEIFTIKGTLDTWGTNDGFHFVWQKVRGDTVVIARVLSVENTLAHAKAGVMLRDTLDAGSKHAQAAITATDGPQFLARTETNGKTTSAKTEAPKEKFPYWVKLERGGDKFSGYESADGKTWKLIGTTNISMNSEIYAGLAGSSHQKTQLGTSTIDRVSVRKLRPVK